MNSVIDQAHPLVNNFDFSIPRQKLDEEINKKLHKLAKTVKIQGFRPGKVPLSVIKNRYGNEAKFEAVEKLAKEVIDDKLKNTKLASQVSYSEAGDNSNNDKDYQYRARYEVYPDFEIDFNKCSKVKNPSIEINDLAINQMIDWLKIIYGEEIKSVDHLIAGGDRIVIDLVMHSQEKDSEGNLEKLLELKNYNFVVPIYKPQNYLDFPADALLGKKADEEVTWMHNYQKDFTNPIIAGKKITLVAKIHEVHHRKTLTDEVLYEKLGLKTKSDDDRKEDIKIQIINQLEKKQKNVLLSRMIKSLIAAHKFEIPPSVLESELIKIGKDLKIHPTLLRNSQEKKHQQLWERFNERGKINASTSIIWLKISDLLPEKVKNEEVLEQIKVISQEFDNPGEVYKNLVKDQQTLMRAYEEVFQDKAINWLKDKMKIEDEKVEFAEFMIG